MDKVAREEVFLPVLRFFSVSIIPPVVVFISALLLPEGRTGDAWEYLPQNNALSEIGEHWVEKHTNTFWYAKG